MWSIKLPTICLPEVHPFRFIKGYRTYIASTIIALASWAAVQDWAAFLSDPRAMWWGFAASALMALMRTFTSTPPGQAESLDTKIVEKLPEPVKQEIKQEIKAEKKK